MYTQALQSPVASSLPAWQLHSTRTPHLRSAVWPFCKSPTTMLQYPARALVPLWHARVWNYKGDILAHLFKISRRNEPGLANIEPIGTTQAPSGVGSCLCRPVKGHTHTGSFSSNNIHRCVQPYSIKSNSNNLAILWHSTAEYVGDFYRPVGIPLFPLPCSEVLFSIVSLEMIHNYIWSIEASLHKY